MARDMGDFQTPPQLVEAILATLTQSGSVWNRILEPTCGRGAFIQGALAMAHPPCEIQGIEIQERYVTEARALASDFATSSITIHNQSIFDTDLRQDIRWHVSGPLLVIGNPPWVTNAELGAMGSANTPRKRNMKDLAGIAAMTGESNFDIAEAIWLKLLRELADERSTIALLCKTSVARNVLLFAAQRQISISDAAIRRIDARRWFNAAVDACLFTVELGTDAGCYEARVYADLASEEPISTVSVTGDKLMAHASVHSKLTLLDGESPLTWYQGVKHDAAAVLELTVDVPGHRRNKQSEIAVVEDDFVFPLLKSSDLGGKSASKPLREIIIPQRRLGEDTRHLAVSAPLLWAYLERHEQVFRRRKSAVYQRQPPFAIFGIGEYSFASYKVAISGLYKTPVFRAIGPRDGRPVFFDDTCYFLPCVSARQAALIASLLNDDACIQFLDTIVFWDAKRPITKKVLQRIDLLAALDVVSQTDLLARANSELARLVDLRVEDGGWPTSLDSLLVARPRATMASVVQLSLMAP